MKRIVSLLIIFIMSFSLSLTFVGCKKNDDSSSADSPASDTSPAEPTIIEFVPIEEQILNNISDLSLNDVKNSDSNFPALVLKDVSVGRLVKAVVENNTNSAGEPYFTLDYYSDGLWKAAGGTRVADVATNAIFNYVPFSGEPLGLTEAQLALVSDQKVANLIIKSVFGVNVRVEDFFSAKSYSGIMQSSVKAGGAFNVISALATIAGNEDLSELAKPIVLMTVGEFYTLTTDNGASLIASYMAKDVDVYIGAAAELISANFKNNANAVAAVKDLGNLCKNLVNGTLSAPEFVDADFADVCGKAVAILYDFIGVPVSEEVVALITGCAVGTIKSPSFDFSDIEISSLTAILSQKLKKEGADETAVNEFITCVNGLVGGTLSKIVVNESYSIAQLCELILKAATVSDIPVEKVQPVVDFVNKYFSGTVENPVVDKDADLVEFIRELAELIGLKSDYISALTENVGGTIGTPDFKGKTTICDFVNAILQSIEEKASERLPEGAKYNSAINEALKGLVADLYGDTEIDDFVSATKELKLSDVCNAIRKAIYSVIFGENLTEETTVPEIEAIFSFLNRAVGGTVGSPIFHASSVGIEETLTVLKVLNDGFMSNDKAKAVIDAVILFAKDTFTGNIGNPEVNMDAALSDIVMDFIDIVKLLR